MLCGSAVGFETLFETDPGTASTEHLKAPSSSSLSEHKRRVGNYSTSCRSRFVYNFNAVEEDTPVVTFALVLSVGFQVSRSTGFKVFSRPDGVGIGPSNMHCSVIHLTDLGLLSYWLYRRSQGNFDEDSSPTNEQIECGSIHACVDV